MNLIRGVEVKKLQIRADDRGMLFEILRNDDNIFKKFGQVYVTTAFPGVVKAWHYHKKQTDHFTCVSGVVKLVLISEEKVNEFVIGVRNPILVSIPPEVFHGFMNVGTEEAIMLNVPTEPYDPLMPDEYRVPWNEFRGRYDWYKRNR